MTRISPLRVFAIVAIFLSRPPWMAAESHPDRTQVNRDIRIEPDDRVGDVTCMHCSVYVRGQVSGDVTTVAGNVFAEPGASIMGDVTVIGGDASVESGSQVGGDVTAIGGALRRDPQPP